MHDADADDPIDAPRPPRWVIVLSWLIGLTIYVAGLMLLFWFGEVVHGVLTASLGPLESSLTMWTIVVTWVLCLLGDSRNFLHRRRR